MAMRSSITKQIRCLLVWGGIFISPLSVAEIEFNTNVLQAIGLEDVDLAAFSGSNDLFAGEYLVDIDINAQNIYYNYPVHLYTKDDESYVCFTDTLLSALPLSKELRSGAKKEVIHTTDAGKCYGLEQYDPDIVVEYDDLKQKIKLRIPHAYTVDFDRYWTPPEERDNGISGLILDYNLLKTFSRTKDGSDHYTYNRFSSYGLLGFNLGRFRFRTKYQYNPDAEKKFKRTQTYAFTDIGMLHAQLYAGELQSRSDIFDSVRFKGASLFTDENMMPNYLQGYAPQITGTATTNAIVTLRQHGNIIKQVQVPPGPFAISNLPSYTNGVIDVTVEEDDGSTQQFQVEVASVPFLTRKGALRYAINAGKFDPNYSKNKIDSKFISTDISYGLSNTVSLNSGLNYTSDREYLAYSIGLGLNLGYLGGFSFDITKAQNKVNPDKHLSGQSYRFNYAKRFARNTSLNIIGYRFSSREYTSLNNYIDMKSNNYENLHLEKNRLSLNIAQYIPQWNMSISATGSKSTYWNLESISYYSVAVSKTFRKGLFANTSVSLSVAHNRNSNYKSNSINLFISIPFESRQGSVTYNANYNDHYNDGMQQVTLYNHGLGGNYSVGVAMNHSRDYSGSIDYALNAAYNTDLSFGSLNSTMSYSSDQQFLSAGFSGSLTLTQHGLATHPHVYNDNTRLIINTNVAGVGFEGNESKSNIFGLAGISNITNYRKNTYKVDNDHLPEDVDIPDNILDVASTKGAIIYRDTHAIGGSKVLITISLPDGSHPPFGATIYKENNNDAEVGIVAEQGLTYLTGLNKKAVSSFIVKWGRDHSCKLQINSAELTHTDNFLCN